MLSFALLATFLPGGEVRAQGLPVHSVEEVSPELRAEHSDEVLQAWIDAYWTARWIDVYWARIVALHEAFERAKARPTPPHLDGIEVCNGSDLPPCYVVERESRFRPNARNPRSSAWGLYQFLAGTWRSVCPEYRHGSATVAQQVECARRLWDGGRGASHWRATV